MQMGPAGTPMNNTLRVGLRELSLGGCQDWVKAITNQQKRRTFHNEVLICELIITINI